jgi:flagellar protein FlaI
MSSDEEIHFIVDDDLVKLEDVLKEIQFRLENPDVEKNKLILQTFVHACAMQFRPKQEKIYLPKPQTPEERFQTIRELRRIPAGKRIYPVPAPKRGRIQDMKVLPEYEKEEVEVKIPIQRIILIKDSYTNKPLALSEVQGDKYVIFEPPLEKNSIPILKEIIKQKPREIKEAWLLLKQLAPNFTDNQLTNLKYYVINAIFALGRIEPLLHDEKINTLIYDEIGQPIKIKRDGTPLKTNIIFKDKEDLDLFIAGLAKKLGKDLSEENPIIDTVIRGFRFHLMLGLHGASSRFTIKRVGS